jgi:hypothetical protein
MAISFGQLTRTAIDIFRADSKDGAVLRGEIVISPLDARLPDVSIQEMVDSGKSAARLRVEKGVGSPVDWIEVQIENRVSRPGRERR